MKTKIVKGNSAIPIFDTKPIRVEISSSLATNELSPVVSRLPSFQNKLPLTTRKCLSSNVTPISSPIIPRSTNNNQHRKVQEFSKEAVESSAKLINDIDVTLSQLSKQYYTDNNNTEDTIPTSLCNNNRPSQFSNLINEPTVCKMMKLKLKKRNQEVEKSYTTSKQSLIPSPIQVNEQVLPRPTKLPVGNMHSDMAYHTIDQDNYRKSSKTSSRRSKSSTMNPKTQDNAYTEAWVYNSHLPTTNNKPINDLLNYIATTSQEFPQYPRSCVSTTGNTTLFQKSIFTQHRHNQNDASQSPIFSPKIPLPNRHLRNNNKDNMAYRDSGIYSSSGSDLRANNNHIIPMTLPQPPPRMSSLASASQNAVYRCPTLSNRTLPNPKDYLTTICSSPKSASKSDRRKARELFASVKQRDDIRNKEKVFTEFTQVDNVPTVEVKTETMKCEVADTPNSDLDNRTVEGYCSDIDNLKNSGYFSDNSGYMSEGGIGLYAQKMQQRFREGLLAVQESMQMTSHNKIPTHRISNLDRDDISSTSSEEIEDYLKELSSRLVTPMKHDESNDLNSRKNSLQLQRKNKMYQERLEKYVCDVEPAADFDITSSCSMDLLTGKELSDVGSYEEVAEYKGLRLIEGGKQKVSPNVYDYGNYSSRKASMDSASSGRKFSTSKPRPGFCEILEAAGPTAASFEDDGIMDGGNNHYRAMSLPGRPRRNNGWQTESTSLSRGQDGYLYPLPPSPKTNSNVYYDVPVTRNTAGRTSGSCTPSLMNVRLPYATINQGVKNSISTTSLGKRDTDTEDIYDGLGSHLSLLSAASYRSLNEERQATEIRKLRRELELAQSKVRTLSGQLSNNVSLQLSNMHY